MRRLLCALAVASTACTTILGIDGDFVQGDSTDDDASPGTGGVAGSSGGAAGNTGGEAGAGQAGVGAAASGGASGDGGTAGADSGVGGSQGGFGGTAGTGASAGTGAVDLCGASCMTGQPGPPMIEIRAPAGGGSYCIDVHEVTNADYLAFLNTVPNLIDQVAPCIGANLSFFPNDWPPPAGTETLPVTTVDFCDAVQFCRWAGKRLCGRIAGGPNLSDDFADPTKSQWFNACSAQGTRAYPYGGTYVPTTCNGADNMVGDKVGFGDLTTCGGGCPGLHHMSGNVREWEDSCKAGGGVFDCRLRGGGYSSGADDLECDASATMGFLAEAPDVGFRCCSLSI